MTCELCGEEIQAHHVQAGQTMVAHRECSLRSVLGGIGHLMDHAHFCGKMNDPDAGLSFRHSALLVDTWVHFKGVEATVEDSVIPPPGPSANSGTGGR